MSDSSTQQLPPPWKTNEDHPRRVLPLPCGTILTYGGTFDGESVLYRLDDNQTWTEVHRWEDDEIRAIAVSPDSRRVIVGFDSGGLQVYAYDDYDSSTAQKHPFGQPHSTVSFAGPYLEAQIRDLQFVPNNNDKYQVAVATEAGMCILSAQSEESIAGPRMLADEATEHHDGSGVRSVTFWSKDYLSSLAMDGRHVLWKYSNNKWDYVLREACITRKDVSEVLGADAWDRSCRAAAVQAKVLVLPGEPFLQLRLGKEEFNDTENIRHNQAIVVLAARGEYVVSSGRDGKVVLWRIETTKDSVKAIPMKELMEMKSPATDLLWTKDDTLYVPSAEGQFAVLRNVTPASISTATMSKSSAIMQEDDSKPVSTPEQKSTTKDATSTQDDVESVSVPEKDMLEFETQNADTIVATMNKPDHSTQDRANVDDEDEKDTSLEKVHDSLTIDANTSKGSLSRLQKQGSDSKGDSDDEDLDFTQSTPQPNKFVEDQAEEDDDDSIPGGNDSLPPASPSRNSVTFNVDHDEDDDDDDDESHGLDPGLMKSSYEQAPAYRPPEAQAAFAPSSTPLDLDRRFLCWNHLGSVTLQRGEVYQTVDIQFTAAASRRPVHFTDNLGFIVGALGEDGAIFATNVGEEVEESEDVVKELRITNELLKKKRGVAGSTIYFHRFETIGSVRDKGWHLSLPDGELVLGCATGEGWAAVMTSRRFVRLFSSGGNQGQVLWLEGEGVTMTGRGRFLAVFYHVGTPLYDGTQKLGYMVYDAVSGRTLCRGNVSCLGSNGGKLSWAGFGNDGSLLVMDSSGVLSMLLCKSDYPASAWEWSPMLDTVGLRRSSEDNFWPITVTDGKLVCVPLRGGIKYPDATRRPVTSVIGFRLPLARGTLPEGNQFEELSVRADIALSQKKAFNDVMTDGQPDDELDQEYATLSAQVDKVTLKLFAASVQAGKLERALDLVARLHVEKSFDLAMVIADNHRRLVDLIEDAKESRFGEALVEGTPDEEYSSDYQSVTPETHGGKRVADVREGMRRVRPRQVYD